MCQLDILELKYSNYIFYINRNPQVDWSNEYDRRVQFSSVQSLSCVRLFVTPWIVACQASLSIINSGSSLRFTSIESVMPSSHLILCRPLLLLPPIPPSIRVFSSESILRMRWPKYWSFSFSIIPSKEISGLKVLQNSCQEGPACGKGCVNLFFFSNHSQVGRVRLSLHGLNKGTLV